MRYDFAEIRRNTSIERVMGWLDLKFHKQGTNWRAKCPACDGAERSLEIYIETNTYYCWAIRKGTSVLDLVMHVTGCTLQESAHFILEHRDTPQVSPKKVTVPQKNNERTTSQGVQPLAKIELKFEHEKVQAHSISAQDAERLGVGFKARGLYAGKVVAPLRTEGGHIVSYAPLAPDFQFPKVLHWPEVDGQEELPRSSPLSNVVKLRRAK